MILVGTFEKPAKSVRQSPCRRKKNFSLFMTCSETYSEGAITKTEQLFKEEHLANPAKPWRRSQASPLDHHTESLDAVNGIDQSLQ